MHRIVLTRAQTAQLVAFCQSRGISTFLVANDHGVYLGRRHVTEECVFYFPGCHPIEDPLWQELARALLWDMAICDELDLELLQEVLAEEPAYPFVGISIEQCGTVVHGLYQLPQDSGRIPPYRPRRTKRMKKARRKHRRLQWR